ncbi:MAG: ATP synthase F0 subunit C [Anaerolineae bacterium]
MWENMDPQTLITILTILVPGIGVIFGTLTPAIVESKVALKAIEGMIRQPEIAGDVRTTMIIAMALLESTAIYALLIFLILIFANPLFDYFFGGGAPESLMLLFNV